MIMTIDDLIKEFERVSSKIGMHDIEFISEMIKFGAISLVSIVEEYVAKAYKERDFMPLRRLIVRWIAIEVIDWAPIGGYIPEYRKDKLKELITLMFMPHEYEYLLEAVIFDIELIENRTKDEMELRKKQMKELEKGKK